MGGCPTLYGTVNCLFAVLRVVINLQSLIIAVSFWDVLSSAI